MDNRAKLGGLVAVIVAAVGFLVWLVVRQAAPPAQQPISATASGGRTATPPPMTPITTP
jgi:hypothetical protein